MSDFPPMPPYVLRIMVEHAKLMDALREGPLEYSRLTPEVGLLLAYLGNGPAAPADLRRRGWWTGTNTAHPLKILEDLGFITKEQQSADRRKVLITLTELGEAMSRKIRLWLAAYEVKFNAISIREGVIR